MVGGVRVTLLSNAWGTTSSKCLCWRYGRVEWSELWYCKWK